MITIDFFKSRSMFQNKSKWTRNYWDTFTSNTFYCCLFSWIVSVRCRIATSSFLLFVKKFGESFPHLGPIFFILPVACSVSESGSPLLAVVSIRTHACHVPRQKSVSPPLHTSKLELSMRWMLQGSSWTRRSRDPLHWAVTMYFPGTSFFASDFDWGLHIYWYLIPTSTINYSLFIDRKKMEKVCPPLLLSLEGFSINDWKL